MKRAIYLAILSSMLVGQQASAAKATPNWVKAVVELWRSTWEQSAGLNHVKELRKMYHPSFRHLDAKMSKTAYMRRLAKGAKKYASWSIGISKLRVISQSPTRLTVAFQQAYSRPGYRDLGTKTLVWRKRGNDWLVYREKWRAAPKPVKPAHAACYKQLKAKVKTSSILKAYMTLPSSAFKLRDDETLWFRRGKSTDQKLRFLLKYGNAKSCAFAKQSLSLQTSSHKNSGLLKMTYFQGKTPLVFLYAWSLHMNSFERAYRKTARGWRSVTSALPKPTAKQKRWMKGLSPYPNNGCPYGNIRYSAKPKSRQLLLFTWAGCNGDPPPDVWLGTFQWTGKAWKMVSRRKKKPIFKEVKGGEWTIVK